MKNLTLVVALMSALSYAREAKTTVAPNLITCEGDQTSFHYTTSSIIGKPTINVSFGGKQVTLPYGVDINVENTRVGRLVSVSDFHLVPLDGPEIRYTLVLPQIELADMTKSVAFESVVIRTSMANPFFRPTPFTGTVHHNEYVNVKCNAQAVFF